jgi:hypothetical protein
VKQLKWACPHILWPGAIGRPSNRPRASGVLETPGKVRRHEGSVIKGNVSSNSNSNSSTHSSFTVTGTGRQTQTQKRNSPNSNSSSHTSTFVGGSGSSSRTTNMGSHAKDHDEESIAAISFSSPYGQKTLSRICQKAALLCHAGAFIGKYRDVGVEKGDIVECVHQVRDMLRECD